MPPTPAQLGAAIRRLRTAQNLSLEGLAAAADIHWTYLSGIERGLRNPTWKILGSLASSLGIQISDIALAAEELQAAEKTG